jgi:Phosphatidylinositol N-acetylglucosaminyltransferase.
MNAAISSSVVLASRLSNDLTVFSLILFSVQTFALFPMLRHRVQVPATVTSFINNGTNIHLVRPYRTADSDLPPVYAINFTYGVTLVDHHLCSFLVVAFCYLPRPCHAGVGSKV